MCIPLPVNLNSIPVDFRNNFRNNCRGDTRAKKKKKKKEKKRKGNNSEEERISFERILRMLHSTYTSSLLTLDF